MTEPLHDADPLRHADPLHDGRCLVTVDAVVVDGANGVCAAPRVEAGHCVLGSALVPQIAVALVAACVFATRGRVRALACGVLATLLTALAVPGARALWTHRADRPAAAASTGAAVETLTRQVERFAIAHAGCVRVGRDACVACQPIVQFALAGAPVCTADARSSRARMDFAPDALSGECRSSSGLLVCGHAR